MWFRREKKQQATRTYHVETAQDANVTFLLAEGTGTEEQMFFKGYPPWYGECGVDRLKSFVREWRENQWAVLNDRLVQYQFLVGARIVRTPRTWYASSGRTWIFETEALAKAWAEEKAE